MYLLGQKNSRQKKAQLIGNNYLLLDLRFDGFGFLDFAHGSVVLGPLGAVVRASGGAGGGGSRSSVSRRSVGGSGSRGAAVLK